MYIESFVWVELSQKGVGDDMPKRGCYQYILILGLRLLLGVGSTVVDIEVGWEGVGADTVLGHLGRW